MNALNRDMTVVMTEDLSVAHLNDEAVLLDVQSGNYYGLNEVGVRILDIVSQPCTVGELVETLAREYEVPTEQLERDVVAFLQDLVAHQLINVEDGIVA